MEFPNFLETEYSVLCYEKPAISIYCKKLETSLQGVVFQKTVGLIFMYDLRFLWSLLSAVRWHEYPDRIH